MIFIFAWGLVLWILYSIPAFATGLFITLVSYLVYYNWLWIKGLYVVFKRYVIDPLFQAFRQIQHTLQEQKHHDYIVDSNGNQNITSAVEGQVGAKLLGFKAVLDKKSTQMNLPYNTVDMIYSKYEAKIYENWMSAIGKASDNFNDEYKVDDMLKQFQKKIDDCTNSIQTNMYLRSLEGLENSVVACRLGYI